MNSLRLKTNLNCGSCVSAVKPLLDQDPAIARWSVDTDVPEKILTVSGDDVTPARVEQHLARAGFKVLGPVSAATETAVDVSGNVPAESSRSFLQTYQPLLLVLAYLLGVVFLVEWVAGDWNGMRAMRTFMGGFFVAFSFFKFLDLTGFATAFRSYDLVARSWPFYGWVYPFVELTLGIAYLLNFFPVLTNSVTLVVMLAGLAGVSWALWQRRQIQCACLGTVFNLPMSKVTFVEDALMAGMAAFMLLLPAI